MEKKLTAKQKRERLWNQIIMKAEGYLGDVMYELAECQYKEEGGAEAMITGKVELSEKEIKSCMFDALYVIDGRPYDLDALRVDREKLVNYWYRQDYR